MSFAKAQAFRRCFSTSKVSYKRHCCKLLVVGGGTGGCSVSARFARKLCKNEIIVLEPCDIHYNQGMFTLIGGGLKKLADACRPMIQVLHQNVTWFKDAVDVFCPQSNMVITKNDDCIEYDFMLIAMGLKLDFDEVCNLREALDNYSNVTTIHSPEYVQKTFRSLRQFVSGNALFTHPFGPTKCPAASLIVCFLAEHYFRKEEKRCDAQMQFASGFRKVFGDEKYSKVLMELARRRHIDMYMCTNLIEIIPDEKKAIFECLEVPGKQMCLDVFNLREALDYYPNVTTIYSPHYVEKTFEAIARCKSGSAFFTHPTGPVKCLAASQKICYLAEHSFQKKHRRDRIDVRYVTPHHTIFPVKTYNDALMRITNQRDIYVWKRMNLIRVNPDENVAVFDRLDEPGTHVCLEYSLLHVTPPMSPPDELKSCGELVTSKGFVKVNPFTLQHENFPNIFAVGDCGGTTNSKTTSAISVQSPVVFNNIAACMEGRSPPMKYCGYSACPILTSYGKGILAEFDYSYRPLETFLCRQDVERAFVYYLKKDVLPQVYWRLLTKGRWNGPEMLRAILRLELF